MRLLTEKSALIAAGVLIAAVAGRTGGDPPGVIVHEWGTFTSIAGEHGRAVPWQPLGGPAELPTFVRDSTIQAKGSLTATVRMETPVLYFYATRDAVVDVTVGFRQGLITEHFPRAVVGALPTGPASLLNQGNMHAISWRDVRVEPGVTPAFPVERAPNHYYAARETEAAPLRVGADRERFLFYRGVGNFVLPLTAVVAAGGEIDVANTGSDKIGALLLFENRRGEIGWRVQHGVEREVRLAPPALDGDVASLRAELERILVDQGLYDKEAAAMVETWRETWFEEGARILYVLPRRAVDSILPLEISPAPADVVRVFLGRVELATAATLTELGDALRTGNRARLARFGRFLRPFAARLLAGPMPAGERARYRALLATVCGELNRFDDSAAREVSGGG